MKKLKLLKKRLTLFLVLFLCINNFAAVVSDNDGSSFITKAEFDSLKNDFQAQIDRYNTSIDNKIDVAIASYLSGIKTEVVSNFTPFVEVTDSTPKIIGRESNYGNVTQQFYNEISAVASIFGCAGGAISVNNPLTIGTNQLSTTWGFWVQPLSNLKSYGRGYEFDENGNVTSIYDDDNIVINMTLTDSCDPWSAGVDFGSWFGWVGFNRADPKENGVINKQYTDYLPHGNQRIYRRANLSINDEHTRDWHDVLNNYDNFLFSHTEIGSHWTERNTDAGRWTGLTNSVYFIHKQENRERDISVYNAVDAKIYAYQKGTKNLEAFADIVDGSLTDKQRRWQLFTYKGSDDATMTAYVSGKNANELYENMRPHRAVYCIGKFKMANITDKDEYKPLYRTSTVASNQWNNLYQFQNGYMSYTWKNNKYSPKFYGGVPLFTPDKDLSKVTFKIKAESTSPAASKIRLWFKEYEFPNDYVVLSDTSWDVTNPKSGKKFKDEVVVVTSNTKTTNTEKFIDIDSNTEVTITMSKPKNGIPYFMKFAEYDSEGNMVGEGGKIVYLSEFQKTIES